MEGTVPLSLKEAVRVLTGGNDDLTARRRSSLSDSPVDILAVVVDITYDRFGQRPAPVDRREFARIWIADDSKDQQQQQQANEDDDDDDDPKISFMISLRNVKDRASIQQHQIAKGDVIRFNRVGIRKTSNNNTSNNKYNSSTRARTTNNTSTIHFYHPFENPEAGLEWFRLGHVSNEGAALVAMERIPDSMKTDGQRLQQLLTWYRHSSSSSTTLYSPLIASLPCQRRTLLQLQSLLVGTLSHVVARVIDIRQDATTTTASSSSSSKKHYKCQKIATTPASLAPSPGSSWCVELSDDGGRHSMLLLLAVDSCTLSTGADAMKQVLVQANETKRPARITLLRTRRDESNIGDDNSEVFLVATNQSTGTLLTASEEVEFAKHEEEAAASSSTQQQQTQLPFSSCTQPQQQTQHHWNPTIRKVKACVREIIMDQDKTDVLNISTLAFTLNEKSTPSECFNFLSQFVFGTSDNDLTRKTVPTFTLELVVLHDQRQQQTQDRQPISPPTALVSSTPAILERLCGGCCRSSVDQDVGHHQKQCKRHLEMLASVLQALLADKVQLEWSLTDQCQQPAASAQRPKLHVAYVHDVTLRGI